MTRGSIPGTPQDPASSSYPGGPVAHADRSRYHIGLGRMQLSRAQIFKGDGKGLAVRVERRVFQLPTLDGLLPPGWAIAQNLPSILAAHVLQPRPGSRWEALAEPPHLLGSRRLQLGRWGQVNGLTGT